MEAILLTPFMCVLLALSAKILVVMLWCMDSVAALKSNGYGLEFSLAGHLDKGSAHWEGGYSVVECRLGVQIFSICH